MTIVSDPDYDYYCQIIDEANMKTITVYRKVYEEVVRVYSSEIKVPNDFDIDDMRYEEASEFWADHCEEGCELLKEKVMNNDEEYYAE
jgi:hypothetical protein